MVVAMCTSGDAVQCVLGPAGSGKTYALAAAAQAWQEAAYTVWGTSVNGTAAEQLGRATGIPSRTLASLLDRLDLADGPLLTGGHVIVVDEASTVGSRDLARLLRHTTPAGTAVRLVGDPAQHSAVDAGGMFRALVERHPDRTPALNVLRRQHGDEMADIRLALTDYRHGRIAEAWQRLEDKARVVTADSPARAARHPVCRLVRGPAPPPGRSQWGGPVVDGG
jgi:ATP-dependent exoDNAse (exonuclease V) alpha subunit